MELSETLWPVIPNRRGSGVVGMTMIKITERLSQIINEQARNDELYVITDFDHTEFVAV